MSTRRFAFSMPILFWSLCVPAVAGVAAFGGSAGLTLLEISRLYSVRVFAVLLTLCVLAWMIQSFYRRAFPGGLVLLGLFFVLLHGILLSGFHFAASVGLGPGEELERYTAIELGPWASRGPIPLAVKEVDTGAETCAVDLGGDGYVLAKGAPQAWRGFELTLHSVHDAPLFTLSTQRSGTLESAYMKMDIDARGGDFFQFRIIPHRFYVSRSRADIERWDRQNGEWTRRERTSRDSAAGQPRHIYMRVTRGKITLLERDLSEGKTLGFDGHRLRYERGVAWARIDIRKMQSAAVPVAGLVLAVAGLILWILQRKRA